MLGVFAQAYQKENMPFSIVCMYNLPGTPTIITGSEANPMWENDKNLKFNEKCRASFKVISAWKKRKIKKEKR